MATAVYTDFKIYNEEFHAGMWEGVVQAVNLLNAASRNTIRLVAKDQAGHYAKEAFLKPPSDIITRRDIASTSAAIALKPTGGEIVTVKVNKKIGPIEYALDAIKKAGENQRVISFQLGQRIGQEKVKAYVNTALIAAEAAIEGQSNLVYDATGQTTKTLGTAHMTQGLQLFGDQAERILTWALHSKPFFDLVREQVAGAVTNVADRVIYGAAPGTLNRPALVTDASSLINSASTNTYNVLGLVENAVVITESEQSEMVTEVVTGLENLVVRIQGEFAFNVGVKGFTWDVTNGGLNPTDASLGTTTNWDKSVTEDKDLAGCRILVQ